MALSAMAAVLLCSHCGRRTDEKATATLHIAVTPSGAEVVLDGQRVGLAPVTVAKVAPAEHTLRLEKHGYEPLRKRIIVTAGQQTLTETLVEVKTAGLTVSSEPGGASVLMDARYVGQTPLSLRDLAPGEHNVLVEKAGFEPWRERVILSQDATEAVSCQLKSKMQSVLEARVHDRSDDILSKVELAHHHILARRFEDAGRLLSHALALVDGLEARDEKVRWVQEEITKAHQAQFQYGDESAVAECRNMLEAILINEVKARPSHTMAQKLLFSLLRDAQRWERMVEAYGPNGMPIDVSDPAVVACYGEALVRTGRSDDALRILLPAYGRHKGCWPLAYAIGLAYQQMGEGDKARIKFKQALLHCTTPDGLAKVRAALNPQ